MNHDIDDADDDDNIMAYYADSVKDAINIRCKPMQRMSKSHLKDTPERRIP